MPASFFQLASMAPRSMVSRPPASAAWIAGATGESCGAVVAAIKSGLLADMPAVMDAEYGAVQGSRARLPASAGEPISGPLSHSGPLSEISARIGARARL